MIKESTAVNCEVDAQNLNTVISNLNNNLQTCESPFLGKEPQNVMEAFLRECSGINLKYCVVVEEIMLQVTTNNEKCTR